MAVKPNRASILGNRLKAAGPLSTFADHPSLFGSTAANLLKQFPVLRQDPPTAQTAALHWYIISEIYGGLKAHSCFALQSPLGLIFVSASGNTILVVRERPAFFSPIHKGFVEGVGSGARVGQPVEDIRSG